MEDLAPLHVSAPFSFEFLEPRRAPNPLLVLEDVDAGYRGPEAGGADKVVLRGVRFSLQAGERYGLLGVNGAGKSTLIKTIAGELAPLAGSAVYGKGLAIGYFAQQQVEMLRDDQSPLWQLRRLSPEAREQALRDFLGGFNFPGEMATGPIRHFSGGEKARLALALIVWQRPNLLLLDEPTNHLDLETREALTVALAQFEGTLVLVSHDRHLLRATTEQLLIVRDGGLQSFDGDLDDYREWLLGRSAGKPAAPTPVATLRIETAALRRADRREAAEARQRQSDARKPIESRLKRLETQLEKLGARKAEIDGRLADSALYEQGDKEMLKSLLLDQAYLARELAQLEAEWLENQTRLEQID
jgi:ATP-binding cassette subfamily F protein 3